jgi:mono/diheme cytochrome c family protein
MVPMRTTSALLLTGIALAGLTWADDQIDRGKYLVEEVAKCQECHTAKTAEGTLDKTKWLKGATLDVAPMHEVPGWHKTAPDLTSTSSLFKRWEAKGLVTFLMTTKNPRGNKADPPMPDYHLSKDDAEAIVAYLKSLP